MNLQAHKDHMPRLWAAPTIGVNRHNNLITPHNGEDEHVSITQRGVLKEEWRPLPAGWRLPRPTPHTFTEHQKKQTNTWLLGLFCCFIDASRRNRGDFAFGRVKKKAAEREATTPALPVAGPPEPVRLQLLVNPVPFHVLNKSPTKTLSSSRPLKL